MNSTDLYNLNVSFYDTTWSNRRMDMPIQRVLNGIRICAYGKEVDAARACLFNGDKPGYDAIKAKLPAVTFCGTFEKGHKADECNHYNNLLVIDIDKLDEILFEETKKYLLEDSHVAAFWVSPSGKGYKGLVHLKYDDSLMEVNLKDRHTMAFRQLFLYLYEKYGIELDSSGKDICRLCYMSADEDIVVKEQAEAFEVKPDVLDGVEDKTKKSSTKQNPKATVIRCIDPKDWNEIYGKATTYVNNGVNRSKLIYIYKKLRKRGISITSSYENWVKVAYAIASSVHPEKGKELFLDFCRLDGINHDEVRSERLIWKAYSQNLGRCSISTILYLAREKGIVLDK